MQLSKQGLKNEKAWKEAGIKLPFYDYEKVWKNTIEEPIWIHFGAGNIFRGFIAALQQELLNKRVSDKGILCSDTFDYDIIDKIYVPHDNLSLFVGLKPDGTMEKEVIASIAEAIPADFTKEKEKKRLKEIFTKKSLQIASFTITEKGYALADSKGCLLPVVEKDIKAGPAKCIHAMSIVTALLYERYKTIQWPIAMVSMDNCSHNGEKLKNAILFLANEWEKEGFIEKEFLLYLEDETKVTFPWSMIDKITPRPDETVEKSLTCDNLEDIRPVITSKNTYIAPFVNAEIPQYLVIEDLFPNGRPALEKAGVYFTSREVVNMTEKMKVTTCLNPLHTALAVYGCLLGYHKISDEMKDEELVSLIKTIGYKEGMQVVTDPKIIHPKDFIDEVVNVRLPNPFIPDTPQRIATDTSQKVGIRFGETLKAYASSDCLHISDLKGIPLAIAGWLRYLLGVDDEGHVMELSSDPMLLELKEVVKEIKYDDKTSYKGQFHTLFENKNVFGVNLIEIGLSEKVEHMFVSMLQGKGAVRNTLMHELQKEDN